MRRRDPRLYDDEWKEIERKARSSLLKWLFGMVAVVLLLNWLSG